MFMASLMCLGKVNCSRRKGRHILAYRKAISAPSGKVTLSAHRNCKAVNEACSIPAPRLESGPLYCRFAGS